MTMMASLRPRAATAAASAPARSRSSSSSSNFSSSSRNKHTSSLRRRCNRGGSAGDDARCRRSKGVFAAFASPSPKEEGDEVVQETLAEMIRLQVGAEEVKELVAKESEKLRESAEKIKAEADALAERRLTEADQGFDAALDDINRMADELAEELAASRAALEADKASARDFERATARARSSATFFQNLYEAPADSDSDSDESASGSDSGDRSVGGGGGSSSRRGRARGGGSPASSPSSSISSSSSSSATSAIREAALSSGPAPRGRSPVRFAVWSVSAIALTGAAVADLFSVSPQITGDLFALATAAVLGYGAAVERRLLDAEEEEKERGT